MSFLSLQIIFANILVTVLLTLLKLSMKTSLRKHSISAIGFDATRNLKEVSELDALKQIATDKAEAKTEDSTDEKPQKATAKAVVGNDSDESSDAEKKEPEKPTTDSVTLSKEFLSELIDSAVAKAVEPFKGQADAAEKAAADAKAALEASEAKRKESEDSAKKLGELFAPKGDPKPVTKETEDRFPMINAKYGVDSGIKGAARDYIGMLESDAITPKRTVIDNSGVVHVQRDYSQLTSFYRDNQKAVHNDMEAFAKKHGLLQGYKAKDFSVDAATLRVDIPDAFLNFLSMYIRENHHPNFIYHQFAYERLELGKQSGDTILVPRFNYQTLPTSAADRQLTPGTMLTSSRQNLTEGNVAISLEELGLGKNAGNAPIAIPEFIQAYSMLELESVLRRNIGYDYDYYEDMRYRNLLFATTKVVYNSNDEIETTALNAAGTGKVTEKFLGSLFAEMQRLLIPTYENGMYVLVLHTKALKQLRDDMRTRKSYENVTDMMELTNILNTANQADQFKISGYMGNVENFMIFHTNNNSVGAPGTEGVQTETLASGAKTTRTSFAFGRNAIAHATGMPMEIRKELAVDFGRLNSFIWISHEGYGHLDTDPAISANQQLRVLQVRTQD